MNKIKTVLVLLLFFVLLVVLCPYFMLMVLVEIFDWCGIKLGLVPAKDNIGHGNQLTESGVCVKISSTFEHYPKYQTDGAACMDLYACFSDKNHKEIIPPKGSCIIGTGIIVELPIGYKFDIRGRSGWAFSLDVVGFDGVIDSDFRDQIKVKIFNLSDKPITISHGERIAQMELVRVEKCIWVPCHPDKMRKEKRIGGFGSTGK